MGLFFIPFIDGLSKTQNGEETLRHENIVKSSDTTVGELGFIFAAFLAGGCNGYSGLGDFTNMVFSSFFESLLCSNSGNKDITKY